MRRATKDNVEAHSFFISHRYHSESIRRHTKSFDVRIFMYTQYAISGTRNSSKKKTKILFKETIDNENLFYIYLYRARNNHNNFL